MCVWGVISNNMHSELKCNVSSSPICTFSVTQAVIWKHIHAAERQRDKEASAPVFGSNCSPPVIARRRAVFAKEQKSWSADSYQ